jgi:hypothetical protein
VRRILEPYASLPPPATPPHALDASLLDTFQQLARVPANLFSALEDEPEPGVASPVDELACAANLDSRLSLLQGVTAGVGATPEIRIEGTPEIRLEGEADVVSPTDGPASANGSGSQPLFERRTGAPTLLLRSKAMSGAAHARHQSALLRLLHVHGALHRGTSAPYAAALLVPLYGVLTDEADPRELAHAEADAFWLFEAAAAEFAELSDEEHGGAWPPRLSQRLAWADDELFANLVSAALGARGRCSFRSAACKRIGSCSATLFLVSMTNLRPGLV